jgi:hypothetical protein
MQVFGFFAFGGNSMIELHTVDATTYRSPNHDERSKSISIIVVHSTASDTLKSAADWLCAAWSDVSTHYIIDEAGNIFCLVDDNKVAWHAGKARWDGTTDVNGVSLGIELVNLNDGKDPYEPVQIAALTWLVEWKAHQYGVQAENIVRHLDVAIPAGRKDDPKGFAWVAWKKTLTVGSDEGVWALWGVAFPLYPDARHFGIPQAWFKNAAKLGAARSNPIYADDMVIQVFDHGTILYRDGKTKVVLDSEIV